MALPVLSPEQRAAALEKAAAARRARRELLDHVKSGETTIPSVLDRAKSDPVVAKTKVSQLVQALPGYGPTKVAGVLDEAGIPEGRRVGGLGPKQHQALINALD